MLCLVTTPPLFFTFIYNYNVSPRPHSVPQTTAAIPFSLGIVSSVSFQSVMKHSSRV